MTDVQPVNNMDQTNFEDAVAKALEKRVGWSEIYESANYGVVAIPRLEGADSGKVVWQEFAAELARETGVGVTCIAHCDWSFTDRPHDEEAVFIAFACPSVPEDYRDDKYRNMIERVDPDTAPSQQDFDDARRARKIVAEHLRELDARREKLIAAGKSDHAATDEYVTVEEIKDLKASDREAVKAVLELDFARAVELMAKPEAPAPGM